MLKALVLVLFLSLTTTQGGSPYGSGKQSFLRDLLQLAEYNDSCVQEALNYTLSYCSSAQGGCHFMPIMQEIQENNEKLQEVKEELQGVKEELQEVQEELQEGEVKAIEEVQGMKVHLQEVKEELQDGKPKAEEEKEMVQQVTLMLKKLLRPRTCLDLLDSGDSGSGLREVFPNPGRPNYNVTVYCEQEVDGGGWTVFQRRVNNSVRQDFFRSWREYQAGFGNLSGEFWIGLGHLHQLTKTEQELRVDLYDYEGQHRWAEYGTFRVGPEDTNYRLTVGRYSGDAGDSMTYHNGHKFSTHDADHDKDSRNCAELYRGAWWYNRCHYSNLNGYQYVDGNSPRNKGIVWRHWRGNHYSLMRTTMMLRPAL